MLSNLFSSGAAIRITMNNLRLNKADFERIILILRSDLDKCRRKYNRMQFSRQRS